MRRRSIARLAVKCELKTEGIAMNALVSRFVERWPSFYIASENLSMQKSQQYLVTIHA